MRKGLNLLKRLPLGVATIVSVCLLLSALVGMFFYMQIRHERQEAIESQMRHNANLAVIFAEQAIAILQDVDGILLDTRKAYYEQGTRLQLDELPTPMNLSVRALLYRRVINEDGKVVVGPTTPLPFNAADRDYYKAQMASTADEMVVGTALDSWHTGRRTVHVSRRLVKPGGGFGGVAVVGLDATIFTELYQKVDMGNEGLVAFVGFDGQVRARRLGAEVSFGGDVSGFPTLRKILAERATTPSGSVVATSQLDGVSRVVSFQVIPSLAMMVMVGTASQEALAGADERAKGYISIALGSTALLLMLAAALSAVFMHQRKHTLQVESLNLGLEQRIEARTRDLKEANRRLESFSYSVSHDLRGPLSTIDGFSGLLQRRKTLQADEPSLALVGRIRSGVAQMALLVDGLLSLATISRGNLHREPVNLSAIANQLLRQHAQADTGREVEVHVHDNMVAQADSRLMTSVLTNLIGNAWKFSAKTPSARIEVGSQAGAEGETVFFVSDNGPGFDMANAGKLFQVFERLDSTSQFEGTGIGLATVRQVVEMHQGKVWAESAPGQGAVFYFTIGE
ncbi:sensor histidine kinase [Polaromonas sp. YR568]|uniref:sensor histidine kinase n=1 Tax=Polaromonas sp. YR568 TaxID=1855301 RepID=UPI00398BC5E0